MSLSIRPVDLAADHHELLCVLDRNLYDVPHQARFRWLYEENPAGPARSWFLCDDAGRAVGLASVFPRAVWVSGASAICGQIGDFCVDVRFRSLGPAIMLQRATFEPVVRGEFAFCYDCPPHERGMAMFHRLGLIENCQMQGYVRPLRTERQMQRILASGAGKVAARLANPFLWIFPPRVRIPKTIEFHLHQGEFGCEFSALDDAVPKTGVIRNRRRAEDLNWRFRKHPLRRFNVLTAREGGELLAYIVYSVTEEDAQIFDLFGNQLSTVGVALLHELSSILRREPIQTVRAALNGNSPCTSVFRQAGFSLRGRGARIVAFGGSQQPDLRSSQWQWQFQQSDVMA